jgi:hypothetical protein
MTDIGDRLDADHIAEAAQFAADQLSLHGVAKVRLAPGDMTEYRFVIATPGIEWAYGVERPGKYYWVTLCANFGGGYEWHGGEVDGGYAAEKWTNPGTAKGTRAWTGEVVARFLTAIANAMRANAVELAE